MRGHKGDIARLRHMLDFARKAVKFTRGRNRADLEDNEVLALATIHSIEIIGEAANFVSPDVRRKHSGVPWDLICGTRNRLIRGYVDVDLDIIWTIIKHDLPPLIKELERILAKESGRA